MKEAVDNFYSGKTIIATDAQTGDPIWVKIHSLCIDTQEGPKSLISREDRGGRMITVDLDTVVRGGVEEDQGVKFFSPGQMQKLLADPWENNL